MPLFTTTNKVPADAAINVARNSTIAFTIPNWASAGPLTVTFSYDADPPIAVVTNGVAAPGFSLVSTPNGSNLDIIISHTANLPADTLITIVAVTESAYVNTHSVYLTGNRRVNFSSFGAVFGHSAFTASCWFNTGNFGNQTDVIQASTIYISGTSSAADTTSGIRLRLLTSNALEVRISDGSTTYTWTSASTPTLLRNRYDHHIIVTWTGAVVAVYVNGIALTMASESGSHPAAVGNPGHLNLNVGGHATAVFWDELAFWNRAFSVNEVTELYNSRSVLDLSGAHSFEVPNVYFPLNNDFVNYGTDASTTGTFAGTGGTLDVDYGFSAVVYPAGDNESVYQNTGSVYVSLDEYVRWIGLGTLTAVADFTVSIWFACGTRVGTTRLVSSIDGSSADINYLQITQFNTGGGDNIQVIVSDGTNTRTATAGSSGERMLTNGFWHHLAVVKTGAAQIQIFLDGHEMTITATSGTMPATTHASFSALALKRTAVTSGFWNFTELQLWPSALTADNVARLYNNARPFSPVVNDHPSVPAPTNWYPLNSDFVDAIGTGPTGAFVEQTGSANVLNTDFGFSTTDFPLGEDRNQLEDEWSFTTKRRPSPQVSVHM